MSPLVQPSPVIKMQFFDANGDPLALGWVYTFQAGTNTPLATYTDHTGGVQNSNPIHLDAGGFADIWLTSSSYKIRVEDANHVPLYTIDGVPGVGSLISVGNLPPLFTTNFTAGGLTFILSDAAAGTLFGRFAGTTGAPSFGAIGSTTQVTFNNAGQMAGSQDLTWNNATKVLSVNTGGGLQLRFTADGSGGKIQWGSGTDPSAYYATDWWFTAPNGTPIHFGQRAELSNFVLGATLGVAELGIASHAGSLGLNAGSSLAGVFAGCRIIGGHIPTPETFISAETGSLFITTNGGAGATLWVKESSPTATTGWVAK